MTDKRFSPFFSTLAIALSLALTLGTAHAADPKPPADNKPVVVVNGTTITVQDVNDFARAVSAARGQQLPQSEVFNTLIDRELLYQAAVAQGLDKRPDVIRELKNQKQSLLANLAANEAVRSQPITDQELHKVYEDRVLAMKGNEIKAHHILVKTEGEAKDIIAQLDKGADFDALAKSKSIDTGSAEKGGDLGWFAPNQVVPEFAQAASKLEKGKYTQAPVKSQFGWHIIRLDDTRPIPPPKFEDVKKQLDGIVQNERLSAYIESLRKQAKIENK
jgi:peptidyl-prolyl cis-trans isomerase C